MVKIKFLGRFREISQAKEINIKYSGTIEELLVFLTEKYGSEFKSALFSDDGELKDYMKILINGEDPSSLKSQELSDDDEVVLFQTIAGG
jgi:molybdopterin synthase sulfur carrier subunit